MSASVALGLLLLPVACFALALWWTRELVSDDPLEERRAGEGMRWWGLALGLLVVAACVLRFTRSAGTGWWVPLLAAGLLLEAAGLRALARRRAACRQVVAAFGFWTAWLLLMLVGFGSGTRIPGLAPVFPPGWMSIAALVAGLVMLWSVPAGGHLPAGASGNRRGFRVVFSLLILALLGFVGTDAWDETTRSSGQLTAYVEAFDAPMEEMTRWEDFGRTVAWLRARGVEPALERARVRMRAALESGGQVHPTALRGALDAGLLGAADLERLRGGFFRGDPTADGAWQAELLDDEGPLAAAASDLVRLRLRMLIAAGGLEAAQRRHLAERLAASLPREPGFGNLEEARGIADLLLDLDARDLLRAHGARLQALLERTWCKVTPRYGPPGGFSAWDPAESHGSDDDANLDALALMHEVGVPPGVDLVTFEAHLEERTRDYRADLGSAHGYLWLPQHLALHRLHAEHEIPYSMAQALQRWHLPVGMGLLLLFLLLQVLRAPVVTLLRPEVPKRVPRWPWLRA